MKNYHNNPNFPHYPYYPHYTPHLLSFAESPGYTLISTLFQSIQQNEELFVSIMENSYSQELINREMKKADDGEMIEEGVGDGGDAIAYLYLMLQHFSSKIIMLDKFTGEILAEIPLTPENLEKNIEELLPSGSSLEKMEVHLK